MMTNQPTSNNQRATSQPNTRPAGSIKTTWQLRTYDVWGNARDGYEVNDTYSASCKIGAVGGYDSGGAYWGVGQRLYGYAAADDSVNGFVRAYDREGAKRGLYREDR